MTEQLKGRELDRAIAEARGWKPCTAWHPARMPHPLMGPGARHEADECPNGGDGSLCMMQTEPSAEQFHKPPPFSASPEWTVALLEEMRDELGGVYPQTNGWRVAVLDDVRWEYPTASCYAPTLGLAVARAWLAWAQAKAPAGEAGASGGGIQPG